MAKIIEEYLPGLGPIGELLFWALVVISFICLLGVMDRNPRAARRSKRRAPPEKPQIQFTWREELDTRSATSRHISVLRFQEPRSWIVELVGQIGCPEGCIKTVEFYPPSDAPPRITAEARIHDPALEHTMAKSRTKPGHARAPIKRPIWVDEAFATLLGIRCIRIRINPVTPSDEWMEIVFPDFVAEGMRPSCEQVLNLNLPASGR